METKLTKTEWTEMFEEAGLNDEMMHQWHQVFERKHPKAHQSFLEWIQIGTEEIKSIRAKAAE